MNAVNELDKKIKRDFFKRADNIQDITEKIMDEGRPVNGHELDRICAYIFFALDDLRKDIIDYLNR